MSSDHKEISVLLTEARACLDAGQMLEGARLAELAGWKMRDTQSIRQRAYLTPATSHANVDKPTEGKVHRLDSAE